MENKKAQLVVIAHDVDPIEVGLTCFVALTADLPLGTWRVKFNTKSNMLRRHGWGDNFSFENSADKGSNLWLLQ